MGVGAVRVETVSDETALRKRAAICALKFGAYAIGYLAMGDTKAASACSESAKLMTDRATDTSLSTLRLAFAVTLAEDALSTLDASLT